jgi:hypothetical protein
LAKIIKQLKGHSSSEVLLIEENDKFFIRKRGNVDRNLERIDSLSRLNVPLPKIIEVYSDCYDMEYIHNLDIKTYLKKHDAKNISNFIKKIIEIFSSEVIECDYSEIYNLKLNQIDFSNFSFKKEELFNRLPKLLPHSNYHGDFTLENILFDLNKNNFVLIDPLTTEYHSYVFDLAKLRQDLVCGWFIRNDKTYLETKLKSILDELKDLSFMEDKSLLILMLMRVFPYSKNEDDKKFLTREIEKLWK